MLKVPLIYINGIRIVQRLVPNRCTSQMRLITRTSNNRYRRWTRRWKHGGWNAIARGGVGAVVIEPWTVARPVSFRFLSFLPLSTFRRAEIMGCENRKDREKYLSAKNVSLTRFASRLSEISSDSRKFSFESNANEPSDFPSPRKNGIIPGEF